VSSPTIHGLLRQAAEGGGDRVAVVDGDKALTYAELDRESNRLAHALAGHGVRPGDRVGLLLEKSAAALVGIYGVLKAGATYVPLDDQAPVRRLGYIARDAGIRCLITSSRNARQWPLLTEHGAPLETLVIAGDEEFDADRLETIPWSALAGYPGEPPVAADDPEALAYVLYTSGSTGEPKGVMLSHRNGLAFVEWAAREVGVQSEDRVSSHAPLHFDLSTFDLFAAARAGARVVLFPPSASVFPMTLARSIGASGITVWYSVPSILTSLVLRGQLEKVPLALRVVIFAGEVFPVKYLRRLMELVPQARYYNFYGPTETNVCSWYEVPRGRPVGEDLPIGKPIPGVEAIVRRPDGEPARVGETGELSIKGPTVMRGYWGDPDRTSRALSSDAGDRVYRTGDLVRYDDDGNLRILGRLDAQIKTRGYRVELGEIESALNALDVVLESAVVAVPDDTITNRLVAFVVTNAPTSASELVRLCRERLPAYMIPGEFALRGELPKSSTGKIDRQQLRAALGQIEGDLHVGS